MRDAYVFGACMATFKSVIGRAEAAASAVISGAVESPPDGPI